MVQRSTDMHKYLDWYNIRWKDGKKGKKGQNGDKIT